MTFGDKFSAQPASQPAMAWEEIEAFVASIEQLSYGLTSRTDFFSRLAEGLSRRLPLDDVQLLLFTADGMQRLAGANTPPLASSASPDFTLFQPGESHFHRDDHADGTIRVAIDHCFTEDEILRIAVSVQAESGLSQRSLQELLGTCAVLGGNFLIRSSGRELRTQLTDRQRVVAMISQLAEAETRSHPESEICRVIQSTLGVDRVSLLWSTSATSRLLGTSANSEIARNSTAVRLIEEVTAQVGQQGERLEVTIGGVASPLSSSLRKGIDAYVEETNVRCLKWIPIRSSDSAQTAPLGFLLLEHFSADWPDDHQQQLLTLAEPHVVDSARRVLSASRSSLWSRLRLAFAGRGRWLAGASAAMALAAILLFTVQKNLEIPVDGVLRPVRRAAVFAPMQGIVDQISVKHGAHVEPGETLMVLRSPELSIEERRISGEAATLRSRLDSLKAARIRNRDTGTRPGNDADLSAEESDLEAQLKGLTGQLALVHEQLNLLVVKSPLAGQIDRWDLNQALADRPVGHGQYLCDVLDVDGDWMIELSIPDDVVGYVLQAQEKAPCPVSYLFRTNADHQYESQIVSISNSAQLDRDGKPVVLARVPAAAADGSQFRVGAGVMARIDCGKRSIGYVYLREMIEFFRRTFWF
ncbi:biotin/lipoyl-binding protein [Planctomicrobium sp. SH661]|uniref:hypothetical protein n=1 Tax=Planctomicrobium sp. SH661 TaxID=3448124 RepID=UPI003F5BAD16